MKKVVIVVPIYNVEKYLEKCIESINNQTYKNIFVIYVNDGSTDGSSSILEKYRLKSKCMIIDKENGGLSSARNAALDYITDFNCYITFVDSDDYIENDYIESLVTVMEKTKSDIVCSSFRGFSLANDIFADRAKSSYVEVYNNYDALKKLFNDEIQSHICTKLYKGELWRNRRFNDSRFMEDQGITFELFYYSKVISNYPYKGYNYLFRLDSLCGSNVTNSKIIDALENYYRAVIFEYHFESEKLNRWIKNEAIKPFLAIYLMMYPRFNYKKASNDEIIKFNYFVNYV